MYQINSLLLKDFYKATHSSQISPNMIKSVSYYTPRKSRVEQWPKVVNFGLQMFIKTWLIDEFNKNFFQQTKDVVISEYKRIMDNSMGIGVCDYEKVINLYDLGYLPIEIVSLPEGMEVPMGCPIFGITNTHEDFAWLPQALESLISAEMWYPMITATVGHTYRKIVNRYYDLTCDDDVPRRRALGNFDFRGDMGVDAALKASAGWLLSFVNTATVPAITFMEEMYNCNSSKEEVGFGAVSTEHFVMCSNSAKDIIDYPDDVYEYKDIDPMRERVFLKKLLTELYPNTSFSCVCDSYDYWNVVKNILPTLKEEILNHNGCMLVRGDSGDCVKVVTETVFELWNIFGGTINSKGYKVLDPHVKAIYGDSITIERAEKIYKVLKENGFAAQNVALGVGSFSMHCLIEENVNQVFTRDTFGVAIKAVYAEFKNEDDSIMKLPVFKDPKTDRENGGDSMKKSHKGCCRVFWKSKMDGEITYEDGLDYEESLKGSLMKPIFRNGKFVNCEEVTLQDIRNKLNYNKF